MRIWSRTVKRSVALLIILALAALPAACAGGGDPSAAATASATATATPAPAPQPVTRTDVPAYFAPGLENVGVLPVQPWHIGVIAGGAFSNAPLRSALETLCARYEESFSLTIDVQAAGSAEAQLAAARSMIGAGADFLILSADGDRSDIGALCASSGVPYITADCRAGTPGQGGYICAIERDDYLIGVLTGLSIADTLTAKYGEARGHIGEITGAANDGVFILRSAGLRRALGAYPDIRVVCSVTTEGDTAYHAAVNVMKAYPLGVLDGIVVSDDAAALEALQAIANYGRDELRGFIWSAGGTKDGLTGVWYGELAQIVEVTAQTGMMALEYALQYLEGGGEGIPPVVCSMTRAFSAGSPQQKDALAAIIAQMDGLGFAQCVDNAGDYALFFSAARLAESYPKHYWEYSDSAAFIAEFAPFTTEKATYAPSPG
jgi:ABC-type sugar transport system substrate-binding protein